MNLDCTLQCIRAFIIFRSHQGKLISFLTYRIGQIQQDIHIPWTCARIIWNSFITVRFPFLTGQGIEHIIGQRNLSGAFHFYIFEHPHHRHIRPERNPRSIKVRNPYFRIRYIQHPVARDFPSVSCLIPFRCLDIYFQRLFDNPVEIEHSINRKAVIDCRFRSNFQLAGRTVIFSHIDSEDNRFLFFIDRTQFIGRQNNPGHFFSPRISCCRRPVREIISVILACKLTYFLPFYFRFLTIRHIVCRQRYPIRNIAECNPFKNFIKIIFSFQQYLYPHGQPVKSQLQNGNLCVIT